MPKSALTKAAAIFGLFSASFLSTSASATALTTLINETSASETAPDSANVASTATNNPLEKVELLRARIAELERGLSDSHAKSASHGVNLGKLNRLLKLQAQEIESGQKELSDLQIKLEASLIEQKDLTQRLANGKRQIRQALSHLPALGSQPSLQNLHADSKKMHVSHRIFVDQKIRGEKRKIEELKRLEDELKLVNEKLADELARFEAHLEDLKEKQSVLTLNREITAQRLENNRSQVSTAAKIFAKAKSEEKQIEAMIQAMPAPGKKLVIEPVRAISLLDRKGTLELPVSGAVVKQFGKKYDTATNLYTFHKGIEIAAPPRASVKAVHSGKVVFAGKLGGYRNLVIVDHGRQFYTLVGNLGEIIGKVGDGVKPGDTIGRAMTDGVPVYFEIRQRHIAINPVPWFRDLSLLAKSRD